MRVGRRNAPRRAPGRTPALSALAALALLISAPAALAGTAASTLDGIDTDNDQHLDLFDNCPTVANPDQADKDADGIGNACDEALPKPVALPDLFEGIAGERLKVGAPGVLANDSPGVATVQESTERTEKGGQVTISRSGAFTYHPPRGFHGVDAFAYRLSGEGGDVVAVVQIAVARRTCANATPTLVGTRGRDVLRGTPGPDVILGRGGDDVILGGAGDDLICGGTGDDRISAGEGDDVVFAGAGDDNVHGGQGKDRVFGEAGGDTLSGGQGKDRVRGGPGPDHVKD